MGNEISLKEAINKLIKSYQLQGKLTETQLNDSWEEIMGKPIAKYTRSLQLNNGRLVVKLSSSVLRQELSYGKNQLIERLNEHFGEAVIRDIVLK
jgi:hypothetical protein